MSSTIWILLALPLHVFCQTSGNEADWFVPDIVSIKPDPYNLITSDFGQPEGRFNWKEDQFALMQRQQRTCSGCTENGKNVVIQNLTLFVNDQEFFVRAMCYNPAPLGLATVEKSSGIGGTGLCSQRRTPYAENDYRSACYDSDYFHGSDSPGRVPSPEGGWWAGVWARDFPIIKSTGANTIRIYNTNPTTRLYTDQVLAGIQTPIDGQIVAPSYGNDHRPFMDAAQAAGLKVIYPLLGDATLMKNVPAEKYQRYLMNQIDEIGNHPALLMYTVGNELNLMGEPDMLAMVNTYIQFARQYSMDRWGRSIPFTHAIVDNPTSYATLYATLNVDVFTSNAGYRGLGFSDLWEGNGNGFPGLGALSRQYNKPNFIGEFGWEQVNGSETQEPINAGWFNLKWKDLIVKGTPQGCIGGAFFEYSDEHYAKADPKQQTMGIVSVRVSSINDFPATTGVPSGYQPFPTSAPATVTRGSLSQDSQGSQISQGSPSQTAQGSQGGLSQTAQASGSRASGATGEEATAVSCDSHAHSNGHTSLSPERTLSEGSPSIQNIPSSASSLAWTASIALVCVAAL